MTGSKVPFDPEGISEWPIENVMVQTFHLLDCWICNEWTNLSLNIYDHQIIELENNNQILQLIWQILRSVFGVVVTRVELSAG